VLQLSKKALPLFLLTLAVGLCFGLAPQGDLLLGDETLLVDNDLLVLTDGDSLLQLWREPYRASYTPLGHSFLALEIFLVGGNVSENVWFFHLVLFLLHIGCSYLVYLLLNRIVRSDIAALFGALLFALHPMQVESVLWISQTGNLLGIFFLLAALRSFFAYWDAGLRESNAELLPLPVTSRTTGPTGKNWSRLGSGWVAYAFAFVLTIGGVLCNPAVAVLPLLLLILGLGLYRRGLPRIFLELLPFLFLAGLTILDVSVARGPEGEITWIAPYYYRPFLASCSLTFYLGRWLLPLWLCVDYGLEPSYWTSQTSFYFLALLPPLLFLVVVSLPGRWLSRRKLLVGMFFIAAAFFPVLGFFCFEQQNFSTVADRFSYLPLFGFALLLSWLFAWCLQRKRRLAYFFALALLVLLAARSANQASYWHSEETLLQRTAEVNPESLVVELANVRREKGTSHAQMLWQRHPGNAEVERLYARRLFYPNGNIRGTEFLEAALKRRPDRLRNRELLIKMYIAQGSLFKTKNQLDVFAEQLGERPRSGLSEQVFLLWFFRGQLALAEQFANPHGGASDRLIYAKHCFSEALRVRPRNVDALRGVALAQEQNRKFAEALATLDMAILAEKEKINPSEDNLTMLYFNRGNVLRSLWNEKKIEANKKEAVASYTQAFTLSPEFSEAAARSGLLLFEAGEVLQGTQWLEKAVALSPHYLPYREALATCYLANNEPEKALALSPASPRLRCSVALHYLTEAEKDKKTEEEKDALQAKAIALLQNLAEDKQLLPSNRWKKEAKTILAKLKEEK